MARNMHDPVYVLGWIAFTGTIGVVVLAYQEKPVPGMLGGIVSPALMIVGQAAREWIRQSRPETKRKRRR